MPGDSRRPWRNLALYAVMQWVMMSSLLLSAFNHLAKTIGVHFTELHELREGSRLTIAYAHAWSDVLRTLTYQVMRRNYVISHWALKMWGACHLRPIEPGLTSYLRPPEQSQV